VSSITEFPRPIRVLTAQSEATCRLRGLRVTPDTRPDGRESAPSASLRKQTDTFGIWPERDQMDGNADAEEDANVGERERGGGGAVKERRP
jgi:hypothetical protein